MQTFSKTAAESLGSLLDRLSTLEQALYSSAAVRTTPSTSNLLPLPQPSPSPHRQLANPSPLGLFGFAIVSTLSAVPKISGDSSILANGNLATVAFFIGALAQLITSIFQFLLNNSHSATTFALFGLHWASESLQLLLASVEQISTNTESDHAADAVYFAVLTTAAIILWIPTFRMNRVLNMTLFFVVLVFTFDIPAVYEIRWAQIVSGVFAVLASILAMYMALLDLVNETWNKSVLPLFPHKEHRQDYVADLGLPYVPRRTFHKNAVSSVHLWGYVLRQFIIISYRYF